MARTPSGIRTCPAGPARAMRPFRMTMLWSVLGAPPVPSINVTLVKARLAVSTATYFTTSSERESGRCACNVLVTRVIKASGKAIGRIQVSSLCHPERSEGSLVNRKSHHHAGREMLCDMAMGHPAAGIGWVEQNIHYASRRHQHRVLPHQIAV